MGRGKPGSYCKVRIGGGVGREAGEIQRNSRWEMVGSVTSKRVNGGVK